MYAYLEIQYGRIVVDNEKNVERLTYSVPETAQAIGVSSRTIHNYIKDGALPCVRIGTRVLIEVEALREFIAGRKQMPKS